MISENISKIDETDLFINTTLDGNQLTEINFPKKYDPDIIFKPKPSSFTKFIKHFIPFCALLLSTYYYNSIIISCPERS